MAGHTLAGAGKAHVFFRGGFHIDPGKGDLQICSDVFHHGRDIVLQLGLLGDHSHIDVAHAVTGGCDLLPNLP